MIEIDLGVIEYYDSKINQFVYDEGGKVQFEYSLKAVYEWEGRWRKPFLKGGLSELELIDFYKSMALTEIDERFLTQEVMTKLAKYVTSPNTATTFSAHSDETGTNKIGGKVYTAEELYYLMFANGIPIEFEERNLNRLMTILRVMSARNSPPKKMTREEILQQNAKLNAERRAALKTKG